MVISYFLSLRTICMWFGIYLMSCLSSVFKRNSNSTTFMPLRFRIYFLLLPKRSNLGCSEITFSFTSFKLINKYICKGLSGDEEQSCGPDVEIGNGKLCTFAFIYTEFFVLCCCRPWDNCRILRVICCRSPLSYFCNGKYNFPFPPK